MSTETEVEVVIIPAADDQIRTIDADLGEEVLHAMCFKCHPILKIGLWPIDGIGLCGRVQTTRNTAAPKCPDCADLFITGPCVNGHGPQDGF